MEITRPSSHLDREYRYLVLENELSVVLVSDPTVKTAAAAMDVAIGSFDDPSDLQGLAHMLEHMLFMGSDKYPQENAYDQFLNEHGGSSNAYTTNEHTLYHFEVEAQHLEHALDIFGWVFKAPLMDPSSTDRELRSVHSEDKRSEKVDSWRFEQVVNLTCDPNHPHSKFVGGNLTSLDTEPRRNGINVRERLLAFHKAHYSSNLMKAAVAGPQSLDELERLARATFSGIVNKKVSVPKHGDKPWLPEHLARDVYIESIKSCRKLTILWPIPSFRTRYNQATLTYLTFLLGHEGPGSLFAYLNTSGWVTKLTSSWAGHWREFDVFEMEIEMTQDGFLHHRDDIIGMMYQYIEMLKKIGPQKQIWDELKKTNQIDFDNLGKAEPVDICTTVAEALWDYPPQDLLRGPYAVDVYNPKDIEATLSLLCPSNMLVFNLAKQFADVTFDQTEKWYSVPYHIRPFSKKLMQKWSTLDASFTAFHIPKPNPFIPETLRIEPFPSFDNPSPWMKATLKKREEAALEFPGMDPRMWDHPELIVDNVLCRAWHLRDEMFPKSPKISMRILIHSPVTYSTPHSYVLTALYCQLIRDSLNEFTYDATQAGIRYNINHAFEGISIAFSGFADKLPMFVMHVISRFFDLKVKDDRLQLMKQESIRSVVNTSKMQPNSQATEYLDAAICEPRWTIEERFTACDSIELEDVKYFKKIFMRQLKLEAMIVGNITRDGAITLLESIQDKFKASTLPHPGQIMEQRAVALPPHTDVRLRKAGLDPENPNSAVVVWYHFCSFLDHRTFFLLDLGANLISETVYDTLRTKEQLGYSVYSETRSETVASGIRFVVQSSEYDTDHILRRIDNCIYNVAIPYLEAMTEEEFETTKQSHLANGAEPFSSVGNRCSSYWNVIEDGTHDFDRDMIGRRVVSSATLADVVKVMKEGFMRHARISIMVDSPIVCKTPNGDLPDVASLKLENGKSTSLVPTVRLLQAADTYSLKKALPLAPLTLEESMKVEPKRPLPTATMLKALSATVVEEAAEEGDSEEEEEEEEEGEEEGAEDDEDEE